MNRPRSVTLICFFYWFSTLYFGAVSLISFFLLFGPYLRGNVSLDKIFSNIAPQDYLSWSLPVVGLGMAVFLATAGWGLWRLKRWAWLAAIMGSGLLVVFGLSTIIVKFFHGEIGIPYLLVLHGLVLWSLFRDNVKVAFEGLSLESHAGTEVREDKVPEKLLSGQGICSKCGVELRQEALFCHKCGAQREEINVAL
jgi:hypothetical protein